MTVVDENGARHRGGFRADAAPNGRLSRQLRESMRVAHAAAERAFGLDSWLVDTGTYAALQLTMRHFYGPAETALEGVRGWQHLFPAVDISARRRVASLDRDLAHLGVSRPRSAAAASLKAVYASTSGPAGTLPAPRQPAASTPMPPQAAARALPSVLPALDSLARGLGCLYVVEGSALGGRVIAARARHALGAQLPAEFLTSRGLDLCRSWAALRVSVDGFGARRAQLDPGT